MVYILLADGFEDMEALTPLDILRRANIETRLVGVKNTVVTSAHKLTVQVDCTLDEVDMLSCEMLVLPGGAGVEQLKATPAVLSLVKEAHTKGKLIAAICAAPTILAELGLLQNRRAVCYPTCEAALVAQEARLQYDENVTHDQHIITAQAAGASLDFALKLVAMLRGWAAADTVRQSICYQSVRRSLT